MVSDDDGQHHGQHDGGQHGGGQHGGRHTSGQLTPPDMQFPAAHFHDAAELAQEVAEAGLSDVVVHGVEGPAGGALERVPLDAPKAPAMPRSPSPTRCRRRPASRT